MVLTDERCFVVCRVGLYGRGQGYGKGYLVRPDEGWFLSRRIFVMVG